MKKVLAIFCAGFCLVPSLFFGQTQACPEKLTISQTVSNQATPLWGNVFQTFQLTGTACITGMEILLSDTFTGSITLTLRTGQMMGGPLVYAQTYTFTSAIGITHFAIPNGAAPITVLDYNAEFNGGGVAKAAWSSANPYSGGYSNINGFPGVNGPEDMWFKVYTTKTIFPVADISNSSPVNSCSNSPDTLLGNPLINATYQWYDSSGPLINETNVNFSAFTASDYHYVVTDTAGCFSTSDTVTAISINAALAGTLQIATPSLCLGANDQIWLSATGDPSITYQWQFDGGSGYSDVNNSAVYSGATNDTLNITGATPSEIGDYRCLVKNFCPTDTSATISLNIFSPAAPAICTATVDSLSANNVIYWDKTQWNMADTFYVYRDTANYNYAVIGKVPYDSLSQFTDTAHNVCLVVTGDPKVTYYKYKIAYKDTCGNMSPMSPYHQTVFMYNTSSLFQWNHYEIEGQPIPVPGLTQYRLMRDNNANGNYILAAGASASSTLISDPQYGTYQTTADWRIETQWNMVCIPTQRQANGMMGTIVKSKSNITNNKTTGVKNNSASITLYPNPTNGVLILDMGPATKEKTNVRIISLLGEVIYNETIALTGKHQIDLSNCQTGTYLVQITGKGFTFVKRVVKN